MTGAESATLEALRAALLASNLRRFIEGNRDGLALLWEGRAAYVNSAWAAFTGRAMEECCGASFLGCVHPDDRESFAARLAEGSRSETSGGEPSEGVAVDSFRLQRPDGQLLIVELLQAEPVELAGVSAMLVLGRDVTELRRVHARMLLTDRMISVGTLAAGVAHEINNPLSYIMGNLSFVQEELPALQRQLGGLPADVVDALEEARQGAERVRQIVRDLQSFARADHQSSPAVDVKRSIELAINMAWIEIRHRARLIKEFGDVPAVEASEARLGQVFLSLLLSAAHALPEGSADKHQLKVVTRAADDAVLVEISHDGPPLPRELAQRLFDPFVTRGQAANGAGLGLSIAHSIIGELAGELSVETPGGKGTLFRVRLLSARARGKAKSPGVAQTTALGQQGRVLVIDDEPLIASSLRRTLRDHEVTVVDSGRGAIELLSSDQRFDLVLCDLMMPELTGMDVYEWLRGAHPELAQRVVFMTGGTFTPRATTFLDAVPNPRIEKPFELAKVREFVRAHVARART